MDSDKVVVKQVTSGTKVEAIGTVKTVVGEVKAIDPSGNERILQAGDKVYPNETIMTAVGALVLIEFVNGTHLDLASSSQIVLDTDVFDPSLAKAAAGELTAEQIQEMIARGEDPTAVTEATAAGAGAGDEGGSSFIVVDFNNTQGNVTSGFNTLGIPGPESTTFTELPPVEDVAVPPPVVPNISVSVEVDVQVGGGEPGEGGVVLIPGGTPITGGVSGAEVIEGSDGFSHSVTFLITLSQVTTAPVTVTYTIVPGTATNPADYFDGAATGTVTIPAGFIGFTVTENIVADILVEGNETFQIVLSNPIGATLTNDTATVTIIDDDHAPVAVDDTQSMTEDQASISGNLLVNDTDADIPGVTGQVLSVTGTTPYTLTNAAGDTLQILNADGDYIFTPSDATKTAAQALDEGESTQVLFSDAYKVTDGANESNLADVTITITGTNDAPVAMADTNWAQEDGADASGNVLLSLPHEGAPSGAFADVADTDVDAEPLTVTGFTGGNAYGTLTLNADGTYSYVVDNSLSAVQELSEGQTLTEVYTYTVFDGTTTNTSTLTVTIFGSNDSANIVTAAATGADNTVYEAGLNPDGSNAGANSETSTGTFDVSATDGILNIVIGGTSFTLAEMQAFDGTQTVNTGEGVLTLTGYTGSATSGTVSYSYTVSATIDNDSKAGATATGFDDSVVLTVNGVGGSTDSDDLVVRIVDDVPTAANDGPAGVTEDGTSFVSGNVLTNDASGADTSKVFDSWTATGHDNTTSVTELTKYGTLVQNGDGTWSYTLNNADADTQALTAASSLSYDLWYTMKDADGDASLAKLTITITGANDSANIVTAAASGPDNTVYEAGLNPNGSDAGSTSETSTGSFTVSATDGILNIVIGGTTYTLTEMQAFNGTQTVNTGEGVLTLTGYTGTATSGTVSYSYTVSATIDNDSKAGATATGFDDSVVLTVNGVGGSTDSDDLVVRIVDDVPSILSKTDLIYANSSNPSPGGTGAFDYSIGADTRTSYSTVNSDFSTITLTGMVGAAAISSQSVTWVSEDANTAVFDVQFSYAANPLTPGVLTQADGTLTFDKVSGTYTLAMDDMIDSFSVLTTSGTVSKENYNLVGSSEAQPEVVVSKLADEFYVRFSGGEEPGGGGVDFKSSDGTTVFNNGETFVGSQAWVSISGSANGVSSDTLQAGEVLNMDFYKSSPGSNASPGAGTATSDGIYIKLDQLGNGEDFVVILKLVDASNPAITTTKAIVIDYGDIYLSSESNPYGITFADGSDGVVIIESNDYNSGGSNWVINGAQLMVSTETVTGSGIDLIRATGDSGGSSGTETFGGDTVDSDVIKISDIGFISTTTGTQDANLSFQFTNVDADGDATATQTLNVTIEGGSTFVGTASAETLQGSAGNDILTGDDGSDIFSWNAGDTGTDTITDFVAGSGGDVLNLSDLLVGESQSSASLADGGYLSFNYSGGNTTITIDTNGATGGGNAQTIVLEGVDLTAGNTLTAADIVTNLLTDGNLKTDV